METAHRSFTHPQPLVCFELCFELIIILSFRKVLHSPTTPWDTKPAREHLACNINRLSEARTVAGWLDWGKSITDLVFARMGNDERF